MYQCADAGVSQFLLEQIALGMSDNEQMPHRLGPVGDVGEDKAE